MSDHARKEAALRAEAVAMEHDPDPRVAYLAMWLVFYIDQLAETQRAWQKSIDRTTRASPRLTMPEDS